MMRVQGGNIVTTASDLTFPHHLEIIEYPTTEGGEGPTQICGGALLAAQLSI